MRTCLRYVIQIALGVLASACLGSCRVSDRSVMKHGEYAYHMNRRQKAVRDSLAAVMLSIPPDPHNVHLFESSIDIGKTLFPIWSDKPNLEQDPLFPTVYSDCDRLYHGRRKLDSRLGDRIESLDEVSLVVFHKLDGSVETWNLPYERYYGKTTPQSGPDDTDGEEIEDCEL